LTIRITEGTQTMVRDVILQGNNHVAGDALRRLLAVKPGRPFDERGLTEDKYNMYAYYADRGFVFASIAHKLDLAEGAATVTYLVTEGEPANVAAVEVVGNAKVSKRIIRREVALKPGDTFSREKAIASQQNLYDTGFFRDIEIEPAPSGADSGSVDLLVRVKERKIREVSAGVGYGTRDEARLTGGWLHRNLWNSGRQFEIKAVLGSKDFDKGLTRKRGDIALRDRWLLGRRLLGVVSVFGSETLEEYKLVPDGEYTLDRVGFNLVVQKDLSLVYAVSVGYTHELVDIRDLSWDVADPESLRISLGQEINRSLSLVLDRDSRRPFFDPHRGSLTRFAAKTAGGVFGGDNSYRKLTASYSRYWPLHRRTTFALGLRVGQTDAFGDSKAKGVPEYERFFAGGSSTIRGYDEQEFGPGNFLLLANAEIRYALFWQIVSVAFFDAGNVWNSFDDVRRDDFALFRSADEYTGRRATDCKYTVGIGLGYNLPVGPARLDYGLKLKRGYGPSGKKEAVGMIHLNIGHVF
jgi:outer membrane protein insertion porin family